MPKKSVEFTSRVVNPPQTEEDFKIWTEKCTRAAYRAIMTTLAYDEQEWKKKGAKEREKRKAAL